MNLWGKGLFKVFEKYKFVVLIIIVGIILLLLPAFEGGSEDKQEQQLVTSQEESFFDLTATEEKLAETLSGIAGAGEVRVMLTLRSGSRQVLAQDGSSNENGENMQSETTTVVVSRGSGNQETVSLQEIAPQFQGALIICPGGDHPEVRLKLTEAVSALTGLGADKISVCKGNETYP